MTKAKSIITRSISLLLAFIIVFTLIPFEQVYAADDGYNGSGGGIAGTGRSFLANWNANKQGIRISIVDKDGNPMLKVSTSINILVGTPPDGTIKLYGNKFQNWDEGKTLSYSYAEFAQMINKAIDAYQGDNKPALLATDGSTIPLPMYFNSNNDLLGNGEDVKQFFIKGKLSSFTKGSSGGSISSDDLDLGNIPGYKPSGGGSSGDSQGGSQGVNLIQTPYGNITKEELAKHAEVLNQPIKLILANGNLTGSEKTAINNMINSLSKELTDKLTGNINALIDNLKSGNVDKGLKKGVNIAYSKAGSNYTVSQSLASSGKNTYEYVAVNNAKIQSLVTSVTNITNSILAVYNDDTRSNKSKIYTISTMLSKATKTLSPGIWSIDGEFIDGMLPFDLIPLAGEDEYVRPPSTPEEFVADILILYDSDSAKFKKWPKENVIESCMGFIKSNTGRIGITDQSFELYFNVSGDDLYKMIVNKDVSGLVSLVRTAKEYDKKDAEIIASIDSFMVDESGGITASSVVSELSGSGEIYGVDVVSSIIDKIVESAQRQGFTDVTREYILEQFPDRDYNRLDNLAEATEQLNELGGDLDQWLKKIVISKKPTFDKGPFDGVEGYLKVLLDVLAPTSDGRYYYPFTLKMTPEQTKEYEKILAASKDSTNTPSKQFIFLGCAVVLEPVYWFRPGVKDNIGGGHFGYDKAKNKVYQCYNEVLGTPTNWALYMKSGHWAKEISHPSVFRTAGSAFYISQDEDWFTTGDISGGNVGRASRGTISGISKSLSSIKKGMQSVEISDYLGAASLTDKNFGYGFHLIVTDNSKNSNQVTWRSPGPSPGGAPDPTDLPDPSLTSEGNKHIDSEHPNGYPNKHFTIVKYYEEWPLDEFGNVKEEEIVRSGPKITENNPNKITVVDEPVYKVKDWYTTAEIELPNIDDSSERYGDWKIKQPSVQTSSSSGILTTVELDKLNNGSENVLHVFLVKEVPEKPLPDNGPGQLTIEQSQITKSIHTNAKNIGGTNWGRYSFNLAIGPFNPEVHTAYCSGCECNGHSDGDGGTYYCGGCYCPGYPCSFHMPGRAGDNKLNIIFEGLHSIQFKGGLEIGPNKSDWFTPKIYSKDGIHPRTLSTLQQVKFTFTSDGKDENGADYTTAIWRYKDIPTLALYKKTDITTRYGDDNYNVPATILEASNTSKKLRISNGTNELRLDIDFGVNQGKSDLFAQSSCDGVHTPHQDYGPDNVRVLQGAWSYTFSANVTVKTWRGENKELAAEPFGSVSETVIKKPGASTHFEFTTVQGKQQIQFFPYIKMTFQSDVLNIVLAEEERSKTARQNTYVLSEQKSQILPSDAIEVGWVNKDENNSLNLISQQWSLHSRAVKGSDGWQGANQVLPGGAMYQLNTNTTQTDVKIVTYQTVVDDKTRQYLSDQLTGDEYTSTKVAEEHKNFIDTAKDVLDNLRIVQWVNKDFKATTAWTSNWDDSVATSQVCVRGGGTDLSKLGLSLKSNTEEKYYMQKAGFGQPASEGDLDIIKEDAVTTVYKCFTDTEGNVYVAQVQSIGTEVGELVEQLKDLNADTITNSNASSVTKVCDRKTDYKKLPDILTGDLKQIDERTKFITNVVKSLERNSGMDKTAAWATVDGKWYNEAFDGVYLVRQATTLKVGLKDPAIRTAALDPALCPPNKGQSDLYSTAFLSQFCMNDKSDSAKAEGKERYYLGTFKGHDITLPDMSGMYQSRKFYIPNANVQDLN